MSVITYNDVDLDIVNTEVWDARLVYDESNCDPLYFHHRMSFTCLVNPSLKTAFLQQPSLSNLKLLQEKLLEPQKKLTITSEDNGTALSLPLPGMKTDARNGPHPIACRVVGIIGVKTVQVVFDIECYEPLNCPDKNTSVLSHRWEASEDIDETFLRTRTITGRATFRTDKLLNSKVVPDDFRARLFHPIPLDHKRIGIQVTQEADGCSVRYSLVDRQVPVNIRNNLGIVKAEGFYQQGFADDKWVGFANRYISVVIRLWGYATTPRSALITMAINAATTYGLSRGLVPPTANPGYSGEITVGLFDRYVEFRAGYLTSGSGLRTNRQKFGDGVDWDLYKTFPEDNGIMTIGQGNLGRDNPTPSKDSGTRTVLEKLVAQALNGKCGLPIAPKFRTSDPKTSWGWDQ